MRTVSEVLKLSTQYLAQKKIAHPRRQAEELLGEALGLGRMGLFLEFNRPLMDPELQKCREWLKRRGQGEPLQYISGFVDFFDCRIHVTKEVLIPRQETEILVDNIVKELCGGSTFQLKLASPSSGIEDRLKGKVLLDLCCGSGCVGIALKKMFPDLTVVLSDLSPEALKVAKENAALNDVDVQFFQGDLCTPLQGMRFDFVVCNPPYVSQQEYEALEIEVREYEPKLALVAGSSGLEFYERLAQELPGYLNSFSKVWLEIGDGQAKRVEEIFYSPNWVRRHSALDWSGHERFFSLECGWIGLDKNDSLLLNAAGGIG